MESAMCFRLTEPFIVNAQADGTVIAVNAKTITVKYQGQSSTQSYKLGYLSGKSGGLMVAQKMVSDLKAGHKFKANHTLAYNDSFFCPDYANPGYSVMKMGKYVLTAMNESDKTIEDSLSISKSAASNMTTQVINERAIVVNFDQAVSQSVKVSESVDYDTVLCYVLEQSALVGEAQSEALEQLKRLGAHSPRSKAQGAILDVLVYYNGDLNDMSPSLKKLAKASDDRLSEEAKSLGKPVYTGRVSSEYRVKAEPLMPDTAVIMYRILTEQTAGTGDKFVMANQLKCTVCSVFEDGEYTTDDGQEIEAFLGLLGCQNRIVNSPFSNGSTVSLVKLMTDKALKAYDGIAT